MPWRNPIVGGEQLLLNSIQSPDYVPGVSGWIVRRDGSAEFNDVAIRGSLDVDGNVIFDGSDLLLVEDPDNPGLFTLVLSPVTGVLTPSGMPIETGLNIYSNDAGVTTGHFNISRESGAEEVFLGFDTPQSPMNDSQNVRMMGQLGLNGNTARLQLNSGSYNSVGTLGNRVASIALIGKTGDATQLSRIEIDAFTIDIDTVNMAIEGAVTIEGTLGTENDVYGTVSVPAGGGAFVFVAVVFPFTVQGTGTISCTVSPSTGSANVLGTSYMNLTTTGVSIGCLRNGAVVNTTVSYHVHRNP